MSVSSKTRTPADTTASEETPLLRELARDDVDVEAEGGENKTPSPIPWGQFTILLILQLSEPLTSQVIYPFLPQLIRDLGVTEGDETRVGFYVGLLQSIFFATQALTVLHWSSVSDHIGRKKVIMIGLVGIALSMYSFGLSKTFVGAVVARSLNGALNGNIGVLKSQFGALFDESNMATAYAYLPIAWSTGSTIGPLIGGALSRPATRFPGTMFDTSFLREYPYFLPCAVPATFAGVAWLVSFFWLEETVREPVPIAVFLRLRRAAPALALQGVAAGTDASASADPAPATPDAERPLPLRQLLTRDVLVAGGNYAALSLLDIAFRGLHPLFLATPRDLGGLGLEPPRIGLVLAIASVCNGAAQIVLFPRLNKRFGSKALYTTGIAATAALYAAFPALSVLADWRGGIDTVVYAAIGVQLFFSILVSFSYGCIFIFITAASPNRASLGGTNGLCQTAVSWMRALGPGLAAGLYSLSLRRRDWTVYWALVGLSAAGVGVATLLPRDPFRRGPGARGPKRA